MENKVTINIVDDIARIEINRPEALNALNRSIVDELDELFDQIKDNNDVRLLIIGGTKNFAAGADIKQMVDCTATEAGKFLFSGTFNKLESLEIPTIAVIDGYALGGGFELALACDLRLASIEAKIGFPETGIGIMPGAGGTVRLPKLIGEGKAKELIFLGTILTGEEAEKIGMVNKAVPAEELKEEAERWAAKLIKKAPCGLAAAKRMVADADKLDKKSAIELEAERWAALFNTDDQKEGMKAHLEKRKPVYLGR